MTTKSKTSGEAIKAPAGFKRYEDGKGGDGLQYRHEGLPLAICCEEDGTVAELYRVKGERLEFLCCVADLGVA
jgi:hypothetical protein